MKKKYSKETITSKAGVGSDSRHGAIVPPLYLTTNFIQDEIGEEQLYEYTRQANPSRDHLISALAELEGGIGGEILSSGMAAVSLITNILELNSKVLLPHDCYGGTFRLFSSLADKGILEAHFIDQSTKSFKENVISEIKPNLIWIESPSNPLLQVVDIEKICKKAKEVNALVAVDNTFLSPSLQNPLRLGSDIVMHSTTKYINGHSDVIGGAVIANNKQVLEKIKFWANNLGITGAPFDSYLTLRGLRTLSIRMKKHEQNAIALVEFLSNNSKVKSVFYPGLITHPSHNLAKKQQNGFGGMLSFELKEGLHGVKNFINQMELLPFAGSLGGFESLIGHPYTQSHGAHTPEQKEEIGISEGLIRISAGLEDTEDLIEAVKKALT
ncbi:MAG: cystathionine gamma-synthase [Gammaproteobacteria bacterium]|nr:cystathionine gamma-synthase [Gammaproteobacteria bacterium]|tara:strand:- start:739 stop:1890 length:1152 start_codon:yes stop_codon:yes gene_type:complete